MNDHHPNRLALVLPVATGALATAAVMWSIGFLTHLPGLQAPAVVTGLLLAVAHLAGGFLMARSAPTRPVATAVASGFFAGLINLLVLGMFLAEDPSGDQPDTTTAVAGYLVFTLFVSGIGGLLGAAKRPDASPETDPSAWRFRLALASVLACTPVVLTGGLVTSHEAGLAVPDWPTSFGANMFLMPVRLMTGGIYYEHAHRLFGTLAGLGTLILTLGILFTEPRKHMKVLAVAAFVFVCVQGVLGGLRVETAEEPGGDWQTAVQVESLVTQQDVPNNFAPTIDVGTSVALAMVHGITAQLFYASLICIAAMLSARWLRGRSEGALADRFLRTASLALVAVLTLQLVLGAGTRHFDMHPAFMHTHISIGALAALVLTLLVGGRAAAKHAHEPVLKRLGKGITHAVFLQVVLGVVVWVVLLLNKDVEGERPVFEVLLASAHQAVGVALLSLASLITLWTHRLTPAS
ncbi:MAG: COX15/CtaA family protein [Planctomycetota bacterium]